MFKLTPTRAKFRTYGINLLESFFDNPALINFNDSASYELGLRFKASVNGIILAIKYWRSPADNTAHVGKIWSEEVTLLYSENFLGETASGWQTQNLATPFQVIANTSYRVSVNCQYGYAYGSRGFEGALSKGNLFAPIGAGCYSSRGSFPNTVFNNNNYYRDVIFRAN